MNNISDYKICHSFIKKACRIKNCIFVDLPVEFCENNDGFGYIDGKIVLGKPYNLGQTMLRIIISYLSNFGTISSLNSQNRSFFDDKNQETLVYNTLTSFFRLLLYSQNSYLKPKNEEPIVKRLYSKTFIWTVMNDVVCPAFNNFPLKNIRILEMPSAEVDVCVLANKDNEDFIYLNRDIEYEPCLDAFLLYETIKAQGMNPSEVISKILDSNIKNVLSGLSKLAYNFDKNSIGNHEDFLLCLMTISEYENKSEEMVDRLGKIAQYRDPDNVQSYTDITDNWWFLGLIEKMLEPARGPDFGTYQKLHPWFKKIWDKIDRERKKRGRNGLSYEALLRIKDGENDPNEVYVIEKKLSTDRVW